MSGSRFLFRFQDSGSRFQLDFRFRISAFPYAQISQSGCEIHGQVVAVNICCQYFFASFDAIKWKCLLLYTVCFLESSCFALKQVKYDIFYTLFEM